MRVRYMNGQEGKTAIVAAKNNPEWNCQLWLPFEHPTFANTLDVSSIYIYILILVITFFDSFQLLHFLIFTVNVSTQYKPEFHRTNRKMQWCYYNSCKGQPEAILILMSCLHNLQP